MISLYQRVAASLPTELPGNAVVYE